MFFPAVTFYTLFEMITMVVCVCFNRHAALICKIILLKVYIKILCIIIFFPFLLQWLRRAGAPCFDRHSFCSCKCHARTWKIPSIQAWGYFYICLALFLTSFLKLLGYSDAFSNTEVFFLCCSFGKVIAIATNALENFRNEAKKMVVALVDMERAFVPPQHFIRLVQRR